MPSTGLQHLENLALPKPRTAEQKRAAVVYQTKWQAANPDKVAKYRALNKPKAKERARKQAALIKADPVLRAQSTEWAYNQRLKKVFNLTRKQYDAMAEQQNGCCAICGIPVERLQVDHDHISNAVRELLCGHCNLGLGQFRDNPEIAIAAAAYLRKHQSRPAEGQQSLVGG